MSQQDQVAPQVTYTSKDIDNALDTLTKSLTEEGIDTSPEPSLSKAVAEPKAEDKGAKIGSGKVSKRAQGGETENQEDFSSDIGTGTVPAASRKGNWAEAYPMDANAKEGDKQDVDKVANEVAGEGYKRGLSKAVKPKKSSSSSPVSSSSSSSSSVKKAMSSSGSSASSASGKKVKKSSSAKKLVDEILSGSSVKKALNSSASSVKKAVGSSKSGSSMSKAVISSDEASKISDPGSKGSGGINSDKSSLSSPNPSGVSVGNPESYGIGSSELRAKKKISEKAERTINKAVQHMNKSFEDGSEKDFKATIHYMKDAVEIFKKSKNSEALSQVVRANRYLIKALNAFKKDNMESHFDHMSEANHSLKKAMKSAKISDSSSRVSKSISKAISTDTKAKKVIEVSPFMKSLVDKISASNNDLKKSVDAKNDLIEHLGKKLRKSLHLNKSLSEAMGNIAERLEKVEKQPLMRKSVTSVVESPLEGNDKMNLSKAEVGEILVKGVEKGLISPVIALSFDDRLGGSNGVPDDIMRQAVEIRQKL